MRRSTSLASGSFMVFACDSLFWLDSLFLLKLSDLTENVQQVGREVFSGPWCWCQTAPRTFGPGSAPSWAAALFLCSLLPAVLLHPFTVLPLLPPPALIPTTFRGVPPLLPPDLHLVHAHLPCIFGLGGRAGRSSLAVLVYATPPGVLSELFFPSVHPLSLFWASTQTVSAALPLVLLFVPPLSPSVQRVGSIFIWSCGEGINVTDPSLLHLLLEAWTSLLVEKGCRGVGGGGIPLLLLLLLAIFLALILLAPPALPWGDSAMAPASLLRLVLLLFFLFGSLTRGGGGRRGAGGASCRTWGWRGGGRSLLFFLHPVKKILAHCFSQNSGCLSYHTHPPLSGNKWKLATDIWRLLKWNVCFFYFLQVTCFNLHLPNMKHMCTNSPLLLF